MNINLEAAADSEGHLPLPLTASGLDPYTLCDGLPRWTWLALCRAETAEEAIALRSVLLRVESNHSSEEPSDLSVTDDVVALRAALANLNQRRRDLSRAERELTFARSALHECLRRAGVASFATGRSLPRRLMHTLYWFTPDVHGKVIAAALGGAPSKIAKLVDPLEYREERPGHPHHGEDITFTSRQEFARYLSGQAWRRER